MIHIEEIQISDISDFWDAHIKYLMDDCMIQNQDEISYFSGQGYRKILEEPMMRSKDRHHMIYFCENGEKIGAASYCTYQSEDGKCFILDYWVFPEFRGKGKGHQCFEALEKHTKADGARYYALNSEKEDSIRFWETLGFVENGYDEYHMPLYIKRKNPSILQE